MKTVVDVAKRAGVSVSTASRALSGNGYVSRQTRQRVLQAAAELGYVPNQVARSLRMNRTKMIGLLISDVENSFYSIIAKNVESVVKEGGYHLILCNSNDDPNEEKEYLSLLEMLQIDGLIITPTAGNQQMLEVLQKKDIAIIQIDRMVEGFRADAILVNNEAGAASVISHLIDSGHYRIGILTGSLEVTTGKQRFDGYKRVLKERGIPFRPELVRSRSFRHDHAIEDVHALIDVSPSPTAIFAANNILAEACLSVFTERGFRIPEDISLVAFDDIKWMSIKTPQITTVYQPVAEMARSAARLLLKRLQNLDENPPATIIFQPTLILRESVAPPIG
jgi:DNA-binding LacI/PurR family transcriptional regulator